jgi:hypothetical protein
MRQEKQSGNAEDNMGSWISSDPTDNKSGSIHTLVKSSSLNITFSSDMDSQLESQFENQLELLVQQLFLEWHKLAVQSVTLNNFQSFLREKMRNTTTEELQKTVDISFLNLLNNILSFETDFDIRSLCLSILWTMTDGILFNSLFLSKETTILTTLLTILQQNDNSERDMSLIIFYNLMKSSLEVIHLLVEQVDLLSVILGLLHENPSDLVTRPYLTHLSDILWSIADVGDEKLIERLLFYDFHVLVSRIVSFIVDENFVDKQLSKLPECFEKFLNFLMNMSSHHAAMRPLVDAGILELVTRIADNPAYGSSCIKAVLTIFFLESIEQYSSSSKIKKSSKSKSQLPVVKRITKPRIDAILKVFSNTLQSLTGDNSALETCSLRLIIKSFLSISESDPIKNMLISTQLISYLFQVLYLFQQNHTENRFCGNVEGNDVITAELAIDTLICLSFGFEKIKDFHGNFIFPLPISFSQSESSSDQGSNKVVQQAAVITSSFDTIDLMQLLIEKSEKLSEQCKLKLQTLLGRLLTTDDDILISTTLSSLSINKSSDNRPVLILNDHVPVTPVTTTSLAQAEQTPATNPSIPELTPVTPTIISPNEPNTVPEPSLIKHAELINGGPASVSDENPLLLAWKSLPTLTK